ncbi:MAG: BrnA antitoxin family protein [Rhodanobacter sp.]|jgi:uncharacterized protein (DUF4415 family)|nr:BrnA antitoxin family protein [Rhodanobacter sp.]
MSNKPTTNKKRQLVTDFEQSLQETLAGKVQGTTDVQIVKRTGGRPPLAVHKQPVTLRMAPDALAKWRASGKGWQTRAAAVLATHAP